MTTAILAIDVLRQRFGSALREGVALAPYTSARIGGPADLLLTVRSSEALHEALQFVSARQIPFRVLGGGSNVLVSDKGVRELVILNQAREMQIVDAAEPRVHADSGVIFSNRANRTAAKGYAGLEWAAAVPGTVGGAVYGNAGAFGGDVASCLLRAEVWHAGNRETWSPAQMGYGYRSSVLKRGEATAIVLAADFSLRKESPEVVKRKVEEVVRGRKATQPPGASMGSMFKNPPGEFAGRLIEAAALKGTRVGNAEISLVHGNFFINHGKTLASDIRDLIELARARVLKQCGVELELEIELVGEW